MFNKEWPDSPETFIPPTAAAIAREIVTASFNKHNTQSNASAPESDNPHAVSADVSSPASADEQTRVSEIHAMGFTHHDLLVAMDSAFDSCKRNRRGKWVAKKVGKL